MIRKPAVVLLVLSLAVLALALVPATGVAAKGGNAAQGGGGGGKPPGGGGSTSSLTLVLMDGATQAAHNGRVTFTVSTAATDRPFVGLRCYQGANWVYDGYTGYFPDYMFDPWFVLDSSYWVDGVAANCDARLFYYDRRGRQIVLTTMSFPVTP